MTAPTLTPTTGRRYPHTPGRDWRLDGNCVTADVDMHPEPRNQLGIAEAKAVCKGCPVAAKCLANAIEIGDWEGIRAGLTGPERRAETGLAGAEQRTNADPTAARDCIDCYRPYTPRTKVQRRCTSCSYIHNHRRVRR